MTMDKGTLHANIAKKIKQYRKANHLTQAQLAEYLHISTTALSHYEQCSRTPDIETLLELENIFGKDIHEFFEK
ncbi:helix-turn-helix domain-containing protein [Weissella minor]|uniref:helix-turn-helix domain-containing protein n=1 Tax=Weissella minor TaxID=1620 RepID=UPI00070AF4E3|nr:helix-turn-helix transcriptional regulator [Weissella minor]